MTSLRFQMTEHARAKDADGDREFALIEGAADVPAALDNSTSVPALYIVRASTRRENSTHLETVFDTFQVLLVDRNVRSSSGVDSSDEIERLSHLVQSWLKDFEPTFDEAGNVDHRFIDLKLKRGQGRNFADQKLVWLDSYELQYARRYC